MSGGSRGQGYGISMGNTMMGGANRMWKAAATNLRHIRELRKKKGSSPAELFRATGSREVRNVDPTMKSSAQILEEFDLARAEAGQAQAAQLQESTGSRDANLVSVGGSHGPVKTGVKSEQELLGGRYAHLYTATATGLSKDLLRERDLLMKYRGDKIKGSGYQTSQGSIRESHGVATQATDTSVRLIGTGGKMAIVGSRTEHVMTAAEKKHLASLWGEEKWDYKRRWKKRKGTGLAGVGEAGSAVGGIGY